MIMVSLVLSMDLEMLNFFGNVFPMKSYASQMLPTTRVLPINTASTSNNEFVEPRCRKKSRTESSFSPDFVTVFLTENGYINYLDDLNENFA